MWGDSSIKFYSEQHHSWKLLANHPIRDKTVIHGKTYIIPYIVHCNRWDSKCWCQCFLNFKFHQIHALKHWDRDEIGVISQTTISIAFFNGNVKISITIPLKFVPKRPINDILVLVQIMAWRLVGAKPLSEPMLIRLTTHICVTRPRWVNWF